MKSGRGQEKTSAPRRLGPGGYANDPMRPENYEWESDSKDNHPPCGMISHRWHNFVNENPIAERRTNAVRCKRGRDRSRNTQRAGGERCQRTAEIPPPTDTQSLAGNENQSH